MALHSLTVALSREAILASAEVPAGFARVATKKSNRWTAKCTRCQNIGPRFRIGDVRKPRIPEEVMEYFRRTGAIGGKNRAKKHSKEQLSEWGRMGGRPKGSGKNRDRKGRNTQ